MKKIYQIIYSVILVSLLPFSLVAGQTKNPEQKIKIIISDDSGKREIIDTLLKDSQIKDSIILKDGNLIITAHSGEDYRIRPHEGD